MTRIWMSGNFNTTLGTLISCSEQTSNVFRRVFNDFDFISGGYN